jgi:hypothetical protein
MSRGSPAGGNLERRRPVRAGRRQAAPARHPFGRIDRTGLGASLPAMKSFVLFRPFAFRLAALSAFAPFAALAVQACGGSANGGGPTPSTFASQFAHAACDNLAPCCKTNGIAYDANNCLVAVEGSVQESAVNTALAAGAIYDPKAASACIAAIAASAQQCNDALTNETASYEIGNPCDVIFVGTKAPGEACNSNYDCAAPPAGDSVICLPAGPVGEDGGAGGNVCVLETPGTLGAPCANGASAAATIAVCSTPGLWCGESGTCEAQVSAGAPCTTLEACVSGLYCLNEVCSPRIAGGSPCVYGQDICVDGYECSAASSTCAPLLPVGASCSSGGSTCAGECDSEGKCTSSSLASPGICGG